MWINRGAYRTSSTENNISDAEKQRIALELISHEHVAKKLYTKIESVRKLCEMRNDVPGICFDYMSNFPLSHMPVQDMFYYRQICVNTFGIDDVGENTAQFTFIMKV